MNQKIVDTLFNLAINNEGINNRFKLSSAIIRKNKIVSVGLNSIKTHPLQAKFQKNRHSIHLHAEIDAIKNALKNITVEDLAKCDLYVVRVKRESSNSKKWIFGNAFPCCGCMRAIETFDCNRVFYSTNRQTINMLERN